MSIHLSPIVCIIGGAVAGMAYTQYGYVSNTIVGAVAILVVAVVVSVFLPEPGRDEA